MFNNCADDNFTSLDSGIKWRYFFGGSSGRVFDRYYESEINGIRVEKHASNLGVWYSIGDINKAEIKYHTEAELHEACLRNSLI